MIDQESEIGKVGLSIDFSIEYTIRQMVVISITSRVGVCDLVGM